MADSIRNEMIVLGLCGRSGAGKGVASRILEELGVRVIDTDAVYRQMTNGDSPCMRSLRREFGDEIARCDGSLDRARMAKIVFEEDPSRRSRLNEITHGYILRETERMIDIALSDKVRFTAVDAPLLFESGLSERCDAVIAITAPERVLLRRITERDGITEKAACARLSTQLTNDELVRRADYSIENDGDTDRLREQLVAVLSDISERCQVREGETRYDEKQSGAQTQCCNSDDSDTFDCDRSSQPNDSASY